MNMLKKISRPIFSSFRMVRYTLSCLSRGKGQHRKIINVTFPRSGNSLFRWMLAKYFAKEVFKGVSSPSSSLKNLRRGKIVAGKFHFCGVYLHCKCCPCIDFRTNFQKTHDFNLKLPNTSLWSYIIQYRQPIESIISKYELMVKEDKIVYDEEKWKEFASDEIIRWKKFVSKWVINNKTSKKFFIPYHKLMEDPVNIMSQVISFINPDEGIDRELLHKIINCEEIRNRRNITDFKYYDEFFLRNIEYQALLEIRQMHLKSYFFD